MEKASYGYGTLWTIKPHLRETKSGKISPVKGFQQKRLRFKPGQRVTRTDRNFHVGGEVLGAKELTARVKWDAGHTTEEPYKNLKLAKARIVEAKGKQPRKKLMNYERLGTMNKADKEKNRLYIISKGTGITFKHGGKIRTFSRSGENLPNGDIPGRVGRQEGTLKVTGEGFKFTPGERKQQWTQQRQGKMVQMHRLKASFDKYGLPGEHEIEKSDGEFYVVLKKAQQQVQVRPYMRAGRAVAGYSAARAKAEMKRVSKLTQTAGRILREKDINNTHDVEGSWNAFREHYMDPVNGVRPYVAHLIAQGTSAIHIPKMAARMYEQGIELPKAKMTSPAEVTPEPKVQPQESITHQKPAVEDFTEKDEEDYYREMASIHGPREPQSEYGSPLATSQYDKGNRQYASAEKTDTGWIGVSGNGYHLVEITFPSEAEATEYARNKDGYISYLRSAQTTAGKEMPIQDQRKFIRDAVREAVIDQQEQESIHVSVGENITPYGQALSNIARKLVDSIRPGDRVTIANRFGQQHTGRAVMRGPVGWVLNMGGPHGRPDIATDENVVKVVPRKEKRTLADIGGIPGYKLGEEQEPYGRKLTFESGPKLRSRDKIAKQIEENFTKPVKFLKPETKKSVNSQLHALGTYHDLIPMKGIDDALEHHGLKILQEDNTEWSGFLLGDSSHTSFPVATIGSAQSKGVVGAGTGKELLSYEPVKNALLNLSWYKLETGRYEILAYIS